MSAVWFTIVLLVVMLIATILLETAFYIEEENSKQDVG